MSFQADLLSTLNQVEHYVRDCDVLEHVLSAYVVVEAKRNRLRRRRGRGRLYGNDLTLWALLLRAVAGGAARDGVVARETVAAFTSYVRDLNHAQLRSLVRRLHAEGLRQADQLPFAA